MSGLVVLMLLAILGAWIATKGMRRIGMPMSKDRKIGLMVVFVIVVLMLWGQSIS